jgi:hypothetical protein
MNELKAFREVKKVRALDKQIQKEKEIELLNLF